MLSTPLILGIAALLYILKKLGPVVLKRFTSPLRHLPGPPSDHWLFGNFKVIADSENSVPQERWMEQYGPTMAYPGMFGTYRFWTMDPRALQHITTHSTIFQKPAQSRYHISKIIGPGILVAEEEQHRHQRRVLNPAFGPAQVRELTSIFVSKSKELRDRWNTEISKNNNDQAQVDALSWLSKTTLDIIGLAGFNYAFDALNPSGTPNELNEAFKTIFGTSSGPRFFNMLQGVIPILRLIPTKQSRNAAKSQDTMRRIGLQLVKDKKAAIMANSGRDEKHIAKADMQGRDLLTLLIKANMASDVPETQRLTDEEVLAQIPTFIVAGHETTSTATVWALFALTQHPEVQQKLRDELWSLDTDEPDMDQLQGLPYLDMFVREVLRHHSPVPLTIREAMQNDVIPLTSPLTDRNGIVREAIEVSKGDVVIMPIKAINRYKPIWGEDAHEFRPERWENPPAAASQIPGVWGHQLTFAGGPRSCIGYRFSLVEMKALLFTLVRAFEFELAVPVEQVQKKSSIVVRPVVVDSNQLPLIIKPYIRS